MAGNEAAIIKEIVESLIEKLGFAASVNVEGGEGEFLCRVRVEGGQNFLIGQHGVNLAAIQHIVRALARKRIEERVNISVDINDYFSDKRALLEGEAERAAEEVRQTGSPVTLRPMLPYERKVVHSFLAKQEGVLTESAGSGEDRRIVVSPAASGE